MKKRLLLLLPFAAAHNNQGMKCANFFFVFEAYLVLRLLCFFYHSVSHGARHLSVNVSVNGSLGLKYTKQQNCLELHPGIMLNTRENYRIKNIILQNRDYN